MKQPVAPFLEGIVQVDVCPHNAGFILSVGRVSLWLGEATAKDVLTALGRALGVAARDKKKGRRVQAARHSRS